MSFLENYHKPTGGFPYMKFQNNNLTSLPHYHEEMEVAYVERGDVVAFSGNREMEMKAGSFCVFMPGEIHGFHSAVSNNVYVMKFYINGYVERTDFSTLRVLRNPITPDDDDYAFFRETVERMRRESLEKKPGYEFAVRACKNDLISYLLRALPHEEIDTSRHIRLLGNVNNYLEENYAEPITLDDVSRACHLSKYYFAHAFKQVTSTTFRVYLTAFRLEKSLLLLPSEELSVDEIAYQCGFGSVRSFDRHFFETYQMSPAQYRRQKFGFGTTKEP